jgi:SET domain-containing protein
MLCCFNGRFVFMHVSSLSLEVRSSGISGNGVYALSSILDGALVTTCAGKIYSTHDCPTTHHALQIGEDLWLWSDGSSLDDNINHSCDPNVGFTGEGLELYSLRTIAVGEEICWDYSTSLIEEGWSLECRCGSKTCRRIILPFFSLSPSVQKQLLPISLGFIRRLYEKSSL